MTRAMVDTIADTGDGEGKQCSARAYLEQLLGASQTELTPLLETYDMYSTEFIRDHPNEFVAIGSDGVLGFGLAEEDLVAAFYVDTDRSVLIRQIPCS